ncbi:TIGR02587 family membrane protein [Planktothrix sp. FACHB-1355]|uniref:TIGR02587 family membrane protein n=1 Tax=Aerosakkonema funiforme FACHB-1375 TaxID=2949571 RepID=A0A926VCA5_9CYAN|nr:MULTISPECIES: TIGR02587 family membrane protein [Oscillatoriales]MBD2181168.1 TIGR02587 family membrane protein [Aerosakkonema funiforme FACHB-1375]MBD3558304.1 TIGR02587 family membrane protein [Planktothrix sp. FACHB-1355]
MSSKTSKNSRRTDLGKARSLADSLQEYFRGVVGGIMFSLPLIYTMEVWWAGFTEHPLRIFLYFLATFTLLLGYNRYAGLRRSASRLEVVIDSVEELGLGILVAAAFLWLLGRITLDMTADEIIGKIVVEAMTVAIGVSVGTAQLGGADPENMDTGMKGEEQQSGLPSPGRDEVDFWGQVIISLCGAVLFAANVAPTEEIITIATQISSERLIGLALVSMLLGTLILFYSNFTGAKQFTRSESLFTTVSGTVITYAVALIASASLLWFFGRFDGVAPITWVAQTVVLALPATLGASAGRLLLQ